ncbi:MAG: Na+/H+ antiporter NhaC [Lachnospiraceae bacterium]
MEKVERKISFKVAVLSMIILALVLIGGFAVLKISTHVVFLLAIIAMGIVALASGFKLSEIEEFFLDGCRKAILVALILMIVGAVIGSWIVSGVVPSIIYYGLEILSPKFFLVAGFFICCIISFFVGSSYSAIATLGVAFMGIGMGLNINPGITAGMVVSGAIFGDKMSPFSDTTNLAPAVAGTDIFRHINSMLYTTIPATIISAAIYTFIGFRMGGENVELETVTGINNALQENFNITPWLLIVPVLTVVLALLKVPPLIALLLSAIVGTIAGFIFQSGCYDYQIILNALGSGFVIESGNAAVDKLLNRGGILGMMGTSSLALLALGLGEMLQRMGVLSVVLSKMEKIIKTPTSLVLTTLGTCLITTCLTASQYIAILLPGQIMKDAYTRLGVQKRVLSRTLEDGGTIFTFLIPWSTTGIYVSGVLGVSVLSYVPYAFLAIICPIIACIYAFTGIAIFKEKDLTDEQREREAQIN